MTENYVKTSKSARVDALFNQVQAMLDQPIAPSVSSVCRAIGLSPRTYYDRINKQKKGATPDKDAPNSTPPATNGAETSSSNCDTGDTGFATPEQIGA